MGLETLSVAAASTEMPKTRFRSHRSAAISRAVAGMHSESGLIQY